MDVPSSPPSHSRRKLLLAGLLLLFLGVAGLSTGLILKYKNSSTTGTSPSSTQTSQSWQEPGDTKPQIIPPLGSDLNPQGTSPLNDISSHPGPLVATKPIPIVTPRPTFRSFPVGGQGIGSQPTVALENSTQALASLSQAIGIFLVSKKGDKEQKDLWESLLTTRSIYVNGAYALDFFSKMFIELFIMPGLEDLDKAQFLRVVDYGGYRKWTHKELAKEPLSLSVFAGPNPLSCSMSEAVYLPNHVRPTHYDLLIRPNLTTMTSFEGEVSVEVEFLYDSTFIVLNSDNLAVSSAEFVLPGRAPYKASTHEREEMQVIICMFGETFPEGTKGTLKLNYIGQIDRSRNNGFYNAAKKGKTLLYTHFEPIFARKAFPCFDEPAFKATFTVAICVPKEFSHLTILSNTEEVSRQEKDGVTCHRFAPTPVMSTYLLTWAIGDLSVIEATAKCDIPVRVFAPNYSRQPGVLEIDKCEASKENAVRVLDFLLDYFDAPFPLKKVGLIGLDKLYDGVAAMENWGLSGFVLYWLQSSDISGRNIVYHEIAHYWFGNLITMRSWNDIWINEGAATFFAEYLETKLESKPGAPSEVWIKFLKENFYSILRKDSQPVAPGPISMGKSFDLFNTSAYRKGATVFRMLFELMGEVSFKYFCQKLLYTFQFSNLTRNELLETLREEENGEELASLVKSWIETPGHPVVRVETAVIDQGMEVTLTQAPENSSEPDAIWVIPINLNIDGQITQRVMGCKQLKFIIGPNSYFKVNSGFLAIYRVEYDTPSLERLGVAIKGKAFSPIDRLNLLMDLCLLEHRVQTLPILKFLLNFKDEENPLIWKQIRENRLKLIKSVVSDVNFYAYEKELTSAAKEKGIISKHEVYGHGERWCGKDKIDEVEEFLANFNKPI